ncbi:carboxypeptidase-like regulatory domain-containing protein [Zobellia sp.]|nr:carboxypeptidase-like regulatory domain-containing protein [Zobellia sp.]
MRGHSKFLLLVIVLTSFSGFSQETSILLNGRIHSDDNDVSNILIVNLNSQHSTITDSLGFFSLGVKLRDTLSITAVQFLSQEIVITDSIIQKKNFVLHLVENVINLNEVTVMPYNLSGKIDLDLNRLHLAPIVDEYTLGLPYANLNVITQSERLLLEADRGNYANFYVIALTINTHKIMNKLSGRTKSFEDMVARDEKVVLEKEIIAKFSKQSISENFNIPETNIDGFLTYCLSQKDFTELKDVRNTMEIWEYLKGKSEEYKKPD